MLDKEYNEWFTKNSVCSCSGAWDAACETMVKKIENELSVPLRCTEDRVRINKFLENMIEEKE